MKKGDKRGQFYLIAAIIISGILISLAYLANYSTKNVSYEAEEIAKELKIEAEYVLDYELKNDKEVLDDFSMRYSDYARDKEIYYIVVDNNPATPVKEAYMFNGNQKIILNDRLFVGPKTIEFNLDEKTYSFPKEEVKNFYFVIIYDKGGERYVYTG